MYCHCYTLRAVGSTHNEEKSEEIKNQKVKKKKKNQEVLKTKKFLTTTKKTSVRKWLFRTSLVAQWLRICLSMQGTRVHSLVWEDPTCHGATKSVHHNY